MVSQRILFVFVAFHILVCEGRQAEARPATGQAATREKASRNDHHQRLRAALEFGDELRNGLEQRHLQKTCDEFCSATHTRFKGSCGGLGDRKHENWCPTSTQGEVCCAHSEKDCCKLSDGGIALLVIGIPLLLGLIVVVSVACY